MNVVVRLCLIMMVSLCGHAAAATPEEDARYIAQRAMDSDRIETLKDYIRGAVGWAYGQPLRDAGLEIVDNNRFMDLIPDEDLAPHLALAIAKEFDIYLSNYSPRQLSMIADEFRADPDISMDEILMQRSIQQQIAITIAVTLSALNSDPLPELILFDPESHRSWATGIWRILDGLPDNLGEAFQQELALITTRMFAHEDLGAGIAHSQVRPDNPVTMAALRAKGILQFKYPEQQKEVILMFEGADSTHDHQDDQPMPETIQLD